MFYWLLENNPYFERKKEFGHDDEPVIEDAINYSTEDLVDYEPPLEKNPMNDPFKPWKIEPLINIITRWGSGDSYTGITP